MRSARSPLVIRGHVLAAFGVVLLGIGVVASGPPAAVRGSLVVLGVLVVVLGILLPFVSGQTELGPQGFKTTIDPTALGRVVEEEAARAGARPEVARRANVETTQLLARRETSGVTVADEVAVLADDAAIRAGAEPGVAQAVGEQVAERWAHPEAAHLGAAIGTLAPLGPLAALVPVFFRRRRARRGRD